MLDVRTTVVLASTGETLALFCYYELALLRWTALHFNHTTAILVLYVQEPRANAHIRHIISAHAYSSKVYVV